MLVAAIGIQIVEFLFDHFFFEKMSHWIGFVSHRYGPCGIKASPFPVIPGGRSALPFAGPTEQRSACFVVAIEILLLFSGGQGDVDK